MKSTVIAIVAPPVCTPSTWLIDNSLGACSNSKIVVEGVNWSELLPTLTSAIVSYAAPVSHLMRAEDTN